MKILVFLSFLLASVPLLAGSFSFQQSGCDATSTVTQQTGSPPSGCIYLFDTSEQSGDCMGKICEFDVEVAVNCSALTGGTINVNGNLKVIPASGIASQDKSTTIACGGTNKVVEGKIFDAASNLLAFKSYKLECSACTGS